MISFLYHCKDFYQIWLYIWVTRQVSYKKPELLTLREHMSSPPICDGVRVAHLFFYVVILCVFTFWVPCCDVSYDFHIKTMFGFSLPPFVVLRLMSYLSYLCLLTHSGVQHILYCVFLSSSCVPAMLPVSLGCPFWIVPLVFSNVYF
jgi:hypothetical protein